MNLLLTILLVITCIFLALAILLIAKDERQRKNDRIESSHDINSSIFWSHIDQGPDSLHPPRYGKEKGSKTDRS